MTHRTEAFLEELAATPQPLLQGVSATIGIDVNEVDGSTQHWLLRLDNGRVDISRRTGRADVRMASDRALFEQLVSGEANALTAGLRGRLQLTGDTRAVVAFARLFPSPPEGHTTVPAPPRGAKQTVHATKAGAVKRTATPSAGAARTTRKDRAR